MIAKKNMKNNKDLNTFTNKVIDYYKEIDKIAELKIKYKDFLSVTESEINKQDLNKLLQWKKRKNDSGTSDLKMPEMFAVWEK